MNRMRPSQLVFPLTNAQGEPRRLGVELELAGLDLGGLTGLLQAEVGGWIEKRSEYEAVVHDSSLGRIKIEFDAAMFRDLKVKQMVADLDQSLLETLDREALERTLAGVAQWVVPFELVFEPLPLARLPELEAVRAALSHRALGTTSSMLYAFGLHLNPELPSLDADTIVRYLRAFLVLYEQLKQSHEINPARSLSGFINPFPREYTLLVLDPKYRPSESQLIDDYLALNPTRNRPLDLLPLLCYLDEARVRARLPEEKIRPRPAFHYRMPDSRVDEADWSITREWEIWTRVERLANDAFLLPKLARYELKRMRGPFWYWLRRAWRTKPLLSRKPLIAVTGPDRGGVVAWACTWFALKRAGGRAIWLRPSQYYDDPYLPPFDGLILGGGADVDPGRYLPDFELMSGREDGPGDESDEYPSTSPFRRFSRLIASCLFFLRSSLSLTASGVDGERDELEQMCLDKAVRDGLPVLGICRGAQFLNVFLGGDLHDVDELYGEVSRHSTLLPTNRVELAPGSILRRLFGRDSLRVNSLHRQAVRRLGEGLQVCARDSAGVIQAVESVQEPFRLGVQWHPEYLPASRLQQKLFKRLVQEALARKS